MRHAVALKHRTNGNNIVRQMDRPPKEKPHHLSVMGFPLRLPLRLRLKLRTTGRAGQHAIVSFWLPTNPSPETLRP